MDSRERAIRRIDQVLEMEASPETAYPIRARLGRAMHEVVRWAESTSEDLPFELPWLRDARARAERIVQPSEPFDVVWQKEWADAMADLRAIRGAMVR